MKTVTKLMMGAAVMAATVGAHASNATLPSTDNSQLMFFVNDLTAHSTYTDVLTQTINGAGGYFTTADATSGGTLGVVNTIDGKTGFSYNFATDSALQTFISNAQTAGDTLQWGLMSGAYSGASATARDPIGNTLFLTTAGGTPIAHVPESNLIGGAPTSYNTDIGKINLQTLDASNGTLNGIFGTTSSTNSTLLNLEGVGFSQTGLGLGTTAFNVYGETSTGALSGQALSYLLGTASFNGTSLVFTGESSVPLPAGAWLLGSGLLGLLGVGRRRRESFANAV